MVALQSLAIWKGDLTFTIFFKCYFFPVSIMVRISAFFGISYSATFCFHRASSGYYGFSLPYTNAAVRREISLLPVSLKNITARLLKLAGYIQHYKILPGNIFVRILKKKTSWPPQVFFDFQQGLL